MRTIRARLLVTLLTGLAVVLTAGGAAVYLLARSTMLQQLDTEVATRAAGLSSLVIYEDGVVQFQFEGGAIEKLGGASFEFLSPSGRVVRQSADLDGFSLPVKTDFGDGPVLEDVALPEGKRGRAAWIGFAPRVEEEEARALSAMGMTSGRMIVVAVVDRSTIDDALITLLGAILGVGAIVALTVGVLVALGIRWGLAPLGRLRDQLGGIAGETMSARIDDNNAPGELLPVYRELNGMLDRVERVLTRERSFADAAAHELRTPLTELRTTAEVGIRWPDTQRSTASLEEMLAIGEEMEHLVDALLQISRGQRSADEVAEEVALAPMVRRRLARQAEPIGAKGLEMSIELEEEPIVHGPRDAVEVIVRNLIDNAVHYTPANGSVRIGGARDMVNGGMALVVENGPVELDESEVSRLFEPFWRQDRSRSDRRHVGLGLSVVQQIARTIGLTVEAVLRDGRLSIAVHRAQPAG